MPNRLGGIDKILNIVYEEALDLADPMDRQIGVEYLKRWCAIFRSLSASLLIAANCRVRYNYLNGKYRGVNIMGIFGILKSLADPEKAKQMSAYMRNQFPFLGVQAPKRKKAGNEYFKQRKDTNIDWDFIMKCWELPEREYQYVGIDYLNKFSRFLFPQDIPNIRNIAVTKSWWDTIDGLDRIVGGIALEYPEVNDILLNWSKDENIWLRRIAIDHQLLRREKTDTILLERIIVNNLGQDEFFINKAIGWILRDYSKTNPKWVRDFINKYKDRLAPLSKREGSKCV